MMGEAFNIDVAKYFFNQPFNYNNYKGVPWILRSLDKKTPMTQAKETIKTESSFSVR